MATLVGVEHRYLPVQGRGTIALPADVRRRLHLDQPGAQLEMTERWQEREKEVNEHAASGRVVVHESTEDFLGHLDELDAV